MSSPAPLRLVVIAPDSLVPDCSDDTELMLAERSRQLRIGLLENGYNVVAVLPTDTFLRERIAQTGRPGAGGARATAAAPGLVPVRELRAFFEQRAAGAGSHRLTQRRAAACGGP
jgi:hypothetical protein